MLGAMKQFNFDSNSSATGSTINYWYNITPSYNAFTSPRLSLIGYYSGQYGAGQTASANLILVSQVINSNVVTANSSTGSITTFNSTGQSNTQVLSYGNVTNNNTVLQVVSPVPKSGLAWAMGASGIGLNDQQSKVYKIEANGAINNQWLTNFGTKLNQICALIDGNVAMSSQNYVGPGIAGTNILISTDSLGTVNWAKRFTVSNLPSQAIDTIGTDNAGNIYVLYESNSSLGYIAKINPQGSIVWQWKFNFDISGSTTPSVTAIDSSNNVYVLTNLTSYSQLLKFDSSGNLTDSKIITNTAGATVLLSTIYIDESNAIYLSGRLNQGSPLLRVGLIVQLTPSLSGVVWAGYFGIGANTNSGTTIGVNQISNINNQMKFVIYGQESSASNYTWAFSLPPNGTFAGNSYVNPFGGNTMTYGNLSNISLGTVSNATVSAGNLVFTTSATVSLTSNIMSFAYQTLTQNSAVTGQGVYPPAYSPVAPPTPVTITYLAIAGGGSGGSGDTSGGGGGGAGGFLANTFSATPSTVYTITVGQGGGAQPHSAGNGITGGNTIISGSGLTTILARGGGGGGGIFPTDPGPAPALPGGSGGGGSNYNGQGAGGAGIAGQGFDGGTTNIAIGLNYPSSGGGGAGGVGESKTSSPSTGGAGGPGAYSTITGANLAYAGGGGGATYGGGTPGAGGVGGGGAGQNGTGNAVAGTDYTGSGGGGANQNAGTYSGKGGVGIVIFSIPTTSYTGTYTGANVIVTTSGSNTIMKFSANGTYTA